MLQGLQKMSVLLAAFVLASSMFFSTTTAQAHGVHAERTATRATSIQDLSVELADYVQLIDDQDAKSSVTEPSISRAIDRPTTPDRGAESSCCGIGTTGCFSGIVSEIVALPPIFPDGMKWHIGPNGMANIDKDGLIRPPQLSV